MKKQLGFTLIEMMIVIAIIGILAAIAIPNYNSYVRKGKLTEGTASLSDWRVRIEQYYQDNRNYGAAGGKCGDTNNDGVTDPGDVAPPTSKYFTYSCTNGNPAQTYTATAASKANLGLGAAGDFTYTITDANAKKTTKFEGVDPGKNCWITSSGGSC